MDDEDMLNALPPAIRAIVEECRRENERLNAAAIQGAGGLSGGGGGRGGGTPVYNVDSDDDDDKDGHNDEGDGDGGVTKPPWVCQLYQPGPEEGDMLQLQWMRLPFELTAQEREAGCDGGLDADLVPGVFGLDPMSITPPMFIEPPLSLLMINRKEIVDVDNDQRDGEGGNAAATVTRGGIMANGGDSRTDGGGGGGSGVIRTHDGGRNEGMLQLQQLERLGVELTKVLRGTVNNYKKDKEKDNAARSTTTSASFGRSENSLGPVPVQLQLLSDEMTQYAKALGRKDWVLLFESYTNVLECDVRQLEQFVLWMNEPAPSDCLLLDGLALPALIDRVEQWKRDKLKKSKATVTKASTSLQSEKKAGKMGKGKKEGSTSNKKGVNGKQRGGADYEEEEEEEEDNKDGDDGDHDGGGGGVVSDNECLRWSGAAMGAPAVMRLCKALAMTSSLRYKPPASIRKCISQLGLGKQGKTGREGERVLAETLFNAAAASSASSAPW